MQTMRIKSGISGMMLIPLLLAALLAMSGCSSKRIAPIQKDVLAQKEDATKLMRQIDRNGENVKPNKAPTENTEGIWLPVRKLRDNELQAAAHMTTSRRISINRDFRSIQEVAERITLLMGVPVSVAPDQASGSSSSSSSSTTTSATATTPTTPPGMTTGGMFTPYGMGSASSYNPSIISLSYDGPLSGFLDVAAARFGLSWEWAGDSIRFYRFTTKTFRVLALPGDTTLQNTVSNTTGGSSSSGSGGGGASTASNQQTGVSSTLSVWSAINDSIKNMLSKDGKVIATAATGTVTVTDTPQRVAEVEKFIENQNASLSKQVVINVRVLSIELTNNDEYGVNWNAVYNSLSKNTGWTFSNAFTTSPSTSNLTLKILNTAGKATNSDIQSWQGSSALIAALASQGHVSQVTSASLTTLNNQPAPLQVGRQTTYLASSTTSVGTIGVAPTTTLTPGQITTGFSMAVVPHILDKGKLMLQYAVNISSLLNMYTVSSNSSSIQAPDIDTRNFLQRVMLNSGDTLVLTGFEQATLDASTQGMTNANSPSLGGGVKGKRNRSVLVILIQPISADI